MFCKKCTKRTFTAAPRNRAHRCRHVTSTANMMWCVRCSYQHRVCEACGESVPRRSTDNPPSRKR